tara:strand:+ start:1203 stop:3911 length:2709 start_codon:yes stop_codon:yes gene_type:complete
MAKASLGDEIAARAVDLDKVRKTRRGLYLPPIRAGNPLGSTTHLSPDVQELIRQAHAKRAQADAWRRIKVSSPAPTSIFSGDPIGGAIEAGVTIGSATLAAARGLSEAISHMIQPQVFSDLNVKPGPEGERLSHFRRGQKAYEDRVAKSTILPVTPSGKRAVAGIGAVVEPVANKIADVWNQTVTPGLVDILGESEGKAASFMLGMGVLTISDVAGVTRFRALAKAKGLTVDQLGTAWSKHVKGAISEMQQSGKYPDMTQWMWTEAERAMFSPDTIARVKNSPLGSVVDDVADGAAAAYEAGTTTGRAEPLLDQLAGAGLPKIPDAPLPKIKEAPQYQRIKDTQIEKVRADYPDTMGILDEFLTEAERARITPAGVKTIDGLFTRLDVEEMMAMAQAGGAKKGWYRDSAAAILQVFGEDAPRFAGLLAAMSPQTGVASNLRNAMHSWNNWNKAGRPSDPDEIVRIMGASVEGDKGVQSVLGAWIPNALRALTVADPLTALSGPKVDSFWRNLMGNMLEVTNDTHNATALGLPEKLFAGAHLVGDPVPGGKGAGYIAATAKQRQAAAELSKATGETWTPAELQETMWSWVRMLSERRKGSGKKTFFELSQNVTDDAIRDTPDFGTLFMGDEYRSIIQELGRGEQLRQLETSRTQRPPTQGHRDLGREGPLARSSERLERQWRTRDGTPAFEARRLQRGLTAAGTGVPEPAVSRIFTRRTGTDSAVLLGAESGTAWSVPRAASKKLNAKGVSTPKVIEVNGGTAAETFEKNITAAKDAGPFGAAVASLPLEDYRNMRLFMTEDGTAGFALKSDGDIVSLFNNPSSPHELQAIHMLMLAVQEGGTKMDNFDGPLRAMYEDAGFKVVRREPWNEKLMPPGWDKKTFARWNNGEPDIVFMEYVGVPE